MKRDKPIPNLAEKLKWAKKVTPALFFTFIIMEVIWHFVISPPKTDIYPGIIAFIYLIPFVILIPGILRGWPANQGALCIVALVYFSRAVINSFYEDDRGIYAAFTAVLLAVLFVSSMYYARWQGRTYMEAAARMEKLEDNNQEDDKLTQSSS